MVCCSHALFTLVSLISSTSINANKDTIDNDEKEEEGYYSAKHHAMLDANHNILYYYSFGFCSYLIF